MPNNPLVFNVTHNYHLSLKQARKAVANCACAWVEGEEGNEIRSLSYAEAIDARNNQPKPLEPLSFAEIPGLRVTNIPDLYEERQLSIEATLGYKLLDSPPRFCIANA